MSYVTDVLLSIGMADYTSKLNPGELVLGEGDSTKQRLKRIDNNPSCYGGSKTMGIELWAAAVNYCDIESIKNQIIDADVEYRESVQLLYADEDDDRLTVWSPADVKMKSRGDW